jgi:tetratricopeptide (TPR) repeat protein
LTGSQNRRAPQNAQFPRRPAISQAKTEPTRQQRLQVGAKANALKELPNNFQRHQRHKEAVTLMRQAFQLQPKIVPEEKFARDMSQVEDTDFVVSLLRSMLDDGLLVTADPWIELGDALQKKEDWHAAASAYKKGLALKSHREIRNEHARVAVERCSLMIAADTDVE